MVLLLSLIGLNFFLEKVQPKPLPAHLTLHINQFGILTMEELIPIVLFISMFGVIGYVTRVISDNRVRREMIVNKVSEDIIQKLFLENRAEDFNSNLKWGIVSVALGTALAIIQMTELTSEEPLTFGLGFLAAGFGLLAYYGLKRNG
ncbi:MAG: TctA family transporter [Candidatus Azotimanducaceae bacterium]